MVGLADAAVCGIWLPDFPPVCLPACLSVSQSVCLPACLLPFLLSASLPAVMSACLPVCLFVCLSVCMPACVTMSCSTLTLIATTRSQPHGLLQHTDLLTELCELAQDTH